jgi:uncharacterized protein (TIGR00369 family)
VSCIKQLTRVSSPRIDDPGQQEHAITATDTSRTRTYSWVDPAALARAGAGLTGLELMRKFACGELPPPPIIAMLEGSIVEADEGRVVFTLTPAEWMFNPIGSVHGGVAATLLDSCMGCAVHTVLAPGSGYTTGDLHIRYLRAMTTETGPVLAEGKVVHAGRRQATAEGRLFVQSTGKLIATGDTACVIL